MGRTRRASFQVLALLVDERFEFALEGDPLELLLPRFAVHFETPYPPRSLRRAACRRLLMVPRGTLKTSAISASLIPS